ncbi:MAG: hypothetical protein R3195_11585 [Gemmatimonadota bacterium]|nr:hypothetical protein [Gemmatimonadota bacterium]
MKRNPGLTAAFLALFTVALPGAAQDLSEVCPGAGDGTGALRGLLSDADAQMALPGATVVATWTRDGEAGRTEVQTALDGSFTMCHVPLDTELSVVGMIGAIAGQPLSLTLTDPITRRDVQVSLSGATAADDRLLACFGAPDSPQSQELTNFVRCDPGWRGLEDCAREDLGRVTANRTLTATRGGGRTPDAPGVPLRDPPDWLEELIEEARDLGANALVNMGGSGELVSAQAARIEVDPATC